MASSTSAVPSTMSNFTTSHTVQTMIRQKMLQYAVQALRLEFFSRKLPQNSYIRVVTKQVENAFIAENHLLAHLIAPAGVYCFAHWISLRLWISVMRRFLRAFQPLRPNCRDRRRTVDELATNSALLTKPLLQ